MPLYCPLGPRPTIGKNTMHVIAKGRLRVIASQFKSGFILGLNASSTLPYKPFHVLLLYTISFACSTITLLSPKIHHTIDPPLMQPTQSPHPISSLKFTLHNPIPIQFFHLAIPFQCWLTHLQIPTNFLILLFFIPFLLLTQIIALRLSICIAIMYPAPLFPSIPEFISIYES